MNQKQTRAVFFLSTGRCGTQWVCNTLQKEYADLAETTHEPVRAAYHAKKYLRNPAALATAGEDAELTAHAEQIRTTMEERHYIETGWPCFALLPWWISQFGKRMSIVHLVRHPVHNSLSLTTQEMYRRTDWMRAMALTPSDRGVHDATLADDWPKLTDYQKCLYFWTEVRHYAGDLQREHPEIPFLTVRFEDLFGAGDQTLRELLDFMELPVRDAALAARQESYDIYRTKTSQSDWTDVGNNRQVAALASEFGYSIDDVAADEIDSRYFGSFSELFRQSFRSLSRRFNPKRRWRPATK